MEKTGNNPPLTKKIIIETAGVILRRKGTSNLTIAKQLEAAGYDIESFGEDNFRQILRQIRTGKL